MYQGTLAVYAGSLSAGELGQIIVYVILLASAFAVLGEVYGDLLRAAGATERLMELLHTQSAVASPAQPQHAPWPEAGSTLALRGAPTPTLLPPKEPMCHDCAERLDGWRIEVDSDEVILRDVHSEMRLVFRRVGDQWVFDSAAL